MMRIFAYVSVRKAALAASLLRKTEWPLENIIQKTIKTVLRAGIEPATLGSTPNFPLQSYALPTELSKVVLRFFRAYVIGLSTVAEDHKTAIGTPIQPMTS